MTVRIGERVKASCGCVNTLDAEWRVLRCVEKCPAHRRAAKTHRRGLAYFTEMGAIVKGIPRHAHYIAEFHEAGLRVSGWGNRVLEIGAGLGMYAPLFLQTGHTYEALEPDEEAAAWVRSTFNVTVHQQPFETFSDPEPYDALMAAHVFEHLEDAPGMMAKAASMLTPGGTLYLIVPDDTDLTNPDHLWFFSEASLRATLERIGFKDVFISVRQRIKRERFLYASAVKPRTP